MERRARTDSPGAPATTDEKPWHVWRPLSAPKGATSGQGSTPSESIRDQRTGETPGEARVAPGRPTANQVHARLEVATAKTPAERWASLARELARAWSSRTTGRPRRRASNRPTTRALVAETGFVRAAPTRSGISRSTAALSFTALLRQGRRRRSLTSTQIVSASRRTWIRAKTARISPGPACGAGHPRGSPMRGPGACRCGGGGG